MQDGTARCAAHKHTDSWRFADSRRGSRHERGYGTSWDKLRLHILARDCGLCQPCLAVGTMHEGTHVDHKINKAEWRRRHGTLAGADNESNLQAINAECHKAKTAAEAKQGRGGH